MMPDQSNQMPASTSLLESFGGPEVLNLREIPMPHAGPGQIRVRVTAAGLNPMDWFMTSDAATASRFGLSLPIGFGTERTLHANSACRTRGSPPSPHRSTESPPPTAPMPPPAPWARLPGSLPAGLVCKKPCKWHPRAVPMPAKRISGGHNSVGRWHAPIKSRRRSSAGDGRHSDFEVRRLADSRKKRQPATG